jgi:hypothetical protein
MTPHERITQLTQALHDIATADNIEDMEEHAAAIGLAHHVEYLEMAYENIQAIALNAIMEEWEAADPWTYIDPERPETMPPRGVYLLSICCENLRHEQVEIEYTCREALYKSGEWSIWDGDWVKLNVLEDVEATPYAWMDWPTAPPYPENEVEE